MTRNIVRTGYRTLLASALLCAGSIFAAPPDTAPEGTIAVKLGDYRFSPDTLNVRAGETVRLELTNTDHVTPHNLTLEADSAGLNVNVDVGPGKTEVVDIKPLVPGSYPFYCNKKLLFLKSHREHGMEGTLIVTPADSNQK